MQMLTNYRRFVIVLGTFILFCLKATIPLYGQQTNTVYIDVALVGDIELYKSFGGDNNPNARMEAETFIQNYFTIVRNYYVGIFDSYDNGVKYELNLMSMDVMTSGEGPINASGELDFSVIIGYYNSSYPCRSGDPDIIHCLTGRSSFVLEGQTAEGWSSGASCPLANSLSTSISAHPGASGILFNWSSTPEQILAFNRQKHTILHEFGHNFDLGHTEDQPFYSGSECSNDSQYLMCEYGETGTYLHPNEQARMRGYITNAAVINCLEPKQVKSVDNTCGHCKITIASSTNIKTLAPCKGLDEFTYITTVENDCSTMSNRKIRISYDPDKFTVVDPNGLTVVPVSIGVNELRNIVNGVEQPFLFDPGGVDPTGAPYQNGKKTFNIIFKLNPNYQSVLGGGVTFVLNTQNVNLVDPVGATVSMARRLTPNSNGIIPNTALHNSPAVFVDGIFRINSEYGFGPNDFPALKQFYFSPGSSFEVNYNGLTIDNLTFSGCDEMWKGIVVNPEKKLVLSNVTVKDAQYGVNVLQNSELTVRNSSFQDNNFAIFSNPATGGALAITLEGNAIFTTTAGLKQSYTNQIPAPAGSTGFAGVYVKNLKNLLVTQSPTSSRINVFSSLKYGLIANNSNVLVSSGRFTNFLPLSKGNGYNAFADAFTPTGTAFVAQQGNFSAIKNSMDHLLIAEAPVAILSGNSKITVREATMDKVDWGVISRLSPTGSVVSGNTINSKYLGITSEFALGGNLEVSDNFVQMNSTDPATYGIKISGTDIAALNGSVSRNTVKIDAGQAGIDLNTAKGLTIVDNTLQTAAATRYGIRVEGGDLNNVKCNDISGAAVGNAAAPATGIYGLMSGRTNYTCNTVSASNFGMRLDGVAIGKSDKISVAGNTFSATTTGLELGADAVIGAQTHQGNKWSGTMTQAVHLGGALLADKSKFIVDVAENSEFIPILVNPFGWFENISTPQNSFTCIQGLNCPLPALVGSDVLDRAVADGSLNGLAHQDAQLWLARRRLYERLTGEDNPYTNDSHFQRFLLDAQSNGIAAYADMQQGIRQLFQVSATDRNLLDAWDAQLATLADTFAGMERRRALDTLAFADSLALENLRSQTLDTIIHIQAQRSQKLANLQAARSLGATALLSQNNALGGAASYQLNEKAVNDVLLRTVAMGLDSFSAAQQQTLSDIAEQCPLADGEAVLRARALRSLYHTAPVVYNDICNEDRERKLQKSDTMLRLFPNPANNLIYLSYELHSPEARFELLNSLGQVLRSLTLTASEGAVPVSLGDLPVGMYFYRLLEKDSELQSGTLIIQR